MSEDNITNIREAAAVQAPVQPPAQKAPEPRPEPTVEVDGFEVALDAAEDVRGYVVGRVFSGYCYEVVLKSGERKYFRDAEGRAAMAKRLDVAAGVPHDRGWLFFFGARSEPGQDGMITPLEGWGMVRVAEIATFGIVPEGAEEDLPRRAFEAAIATAQAQLRAAGVFDQAVAAVVPESGGEPAPGAPEGVPVGDGPSGADLLGS